MQYRREIDGLRALAVVPVILFHAGFEVFSGGFIGVDVFFVISGYLITNIIYGEIQAGEFSLVRFYERRIRRILPALIFVSLVCIPFAWLWMLPGEFSGFARSLVAVNIFASNILFLQENSKYFSASAELMPMLHTWSLAVEEQFYLLFPLFLLIVTRFGRRVVLALLLFCAAVSLGVSDWGAKTYPLMNFYLLPTRAWELGVGAILAIYGTNHLRQSTWVAQFASMAGALMIVYSFLVYDQHTATPSLWSLVPVLGTALIIAFGSENTFIGRILGWKPIVGIGLISYSAYLWHQPVFAFARIRFWDGITDAAYLGLSVLALVLAYFSWRFVEQPFRNRSLVGRGTVFASAAGFSAVLIVFGVVGHQASGFPGRHESGVLMASLEDRLRPNRGLNDICNTVFKLVPECRTSDAPEIIVWGDSHAMHLVSGITASNPEAAIIQMTKSRCGPFIGATYFQPPKTNMKSVRSCLEFNEKVKNYISETKTLKYAVLASIFKHYVSKESSIYFDEKLHETEMDFVVERFKSTLDWLIQNGVTPVVFESPPRNGKDVVACLNRSTWFGESTQDCSNSLATYRRLTSNVEEFFSRIEDEYQVVKLKDYLCNGDECVVQKDGVFIYRDSSHLSHEGARHIGREMGFYDLIAGTKTTQKTQ